MTFLMLFLFFFCVCVLYNPAKRRNVTRVSVRGDGGGKEEEDERKLKREAKKVEAKW